MKVIIMRSNPVSPDSRVEKEADALNKANHEVMILAWDRSASENEKGKIKVPSGTINILRIGEKANFGGGLKQNLLPLIKVQLKFLIYLMKNHKKYDVIHACDFENAFTGLICAKIFKKKLVYDIYDYYIDSHKLPKILNLIVEKIDGKIINSSDCVIICSEKRREQIGHTEPKMLEIIHNSPSKLQMHYNKPFEVQSNTNLTRIVYVGILSKSRLLKELIQCVRSRKDCELHIGGFGQLEKYVIENSEKYENIYFYGKLPYNQTLQLENQCDIMTAIYDPSINNHYYAAPNKFYEALLLGKPLIMVENTGMDQVVKDYNFGSVISYSQNSLDRGITSLISRKEEWEKTSIKMKEMHENKYSWDIMEKKLQSIYMKLDLKSGI